MQGKESKHSQIKNDLKFGTNRSCAEGKNNKWFQVMKNHYIRAFYLPYLFEIPPVYHSHYTTRILPVTESQCNCSWQLNGNDLACEVCNESEEILKCAADGFLTNQIEIIMKPVTCDSCREHFSDIEALRIHNRTAHTSTAHADMSLQNLHVRSMKVVDIKAVLSKNGLSTAGSKDILMRRLESFLSYRS